MSSACRSSSARISRLSAACLPASRATFAMAHRCLASTTRRPSPVAATGTCGSREAPIRWAASRASVTLRPTCTRSRISSARARGISSARTRDRTTSIPRVRHSTERRATCSSRREPADTGSTAPRSDSSRPASSSTTLGVSARPTGRMRPRA